MGTTLTGTTPQDTYDSLIKVTDNGPLSGTLKALSDGLGNDSTLSLSTTAASIAGTLAVTGNATFDTNTLFVDAANNAVGIGTASPVGKLTIAGTSAQPPSSGTTPNSLLQIKGSLGNQLNIGSNTATGDYGSYIQASDTNLAVPYPLNLQPIGGNVGIGTSSPTTTLDVLGTSFLRGNVNAGKTADINVTTAVNGTGGGNREFTTFTGASATGFTGNDTSDQGYGYFAATIVSGRSYEVSATMVVTNGSPLIFITSNGLNFATNTVQTVQVTPVSNTTYRFVATAAASFFGIAAANNGGTMNCVVSNFSLKEVGSVLVASDSNVGVGTTAPAVKLDVVGDIRSSTGILFGTDTAAANLLDDYEEGTWTMGISFGGASVGVTYALNTGTYTKIGRQVTVNGLMALSSKGSSTGSAKITGLPFPIGGAQSNYPTANLRMEFVTFANQFQAYGDPASATITVQEITEAGVVTTISNADFANNSEIILSLTYFV